MACWPRRRCDFRYPTQQLFSNYAFARETMFEKGIPDQVLTVKDEDAREMANRLCREEGLFCGMSSGANVYAAIQLAKKMKKGRVG